MKMKKLMKYNEENLKPLLKGLYNSAILIENYLISQNKKVEDNKLYSLNLDFVIHETKNVDLYNINIEEKK